MLKVIILYPNTRGATFDMAYYTGKHLPMVKEKCAGACKATGAERGLSGGEPGSKPPYLAIGYLTFDSLESFGKSFGPHAAQIVRRRTELHERPADHPDERGSRLTERGRPRRSRGRAVRGRTRRAGPVGAHRTHRSAMRLRMHPVVGLEELAGE